MSWFTAEHQVLYASVTLAAESRPGFPAWQLALTLQQFFHHGGLYHDRAHTMQIALQAAQVVLGNAAGGAARLDSAWDSKIMDHRSWPTDLAIH